MDHQDYQLITVSEADDWAAYHDIRRKILFEARGKFAYDPNHPDEYDPKNKPLLLKFRGVPIGTTRLDFLRTKEGVIRLVAIKTEYQNAGHGRVLSTLVEDRAKANGITTLFAKCGPGSGSILRENWLRKACLVTFRTTGNSCRLHPDEETASAPSLTPAG